MPTDAPSPTALLTREEREQLVEHIRDFIDPWRTGYDDERGKLDRLSAYAAALEGKVEAEIQSRDGWRDAWHKSQAELETVREERDNLRDLYGDATTERTRLAGQVAAAKAIHVNLNGGCLICADPNDGQPMPWPCPTLSTLTGGDDE